MARSCLLRARPCRVQLLAGKQRGSMDKLLRAPTASICELCPHSCHVAPYPLNVHFWAPPLCVPVQSVSLPPPPRMTSL